MRYLITGGAGFIGSHLSEKLISGGHEVTILDNLATGSEQNLSRIKDQIKFFKGNILEFELIDELIKESDFVVHLAASLGVFNIVNKPLESLLTNLKGSGLVIEAADKYKKPILIASTSEIYGKNSKDFLSENDDRVIGHPLKSRWSYSEAKAVDESLAYFYYTEKNLPVRIVRFFNTVGPRQVGDYGMVLPRFVSSALRGEPIRVYGDGEQVRSFCHVNDVVNAILLVINSQNSIGQVFNIGSNQCLSIMELAKKVVEITGSSSLIEKVPYEDVYADGFEDMQRRVPDISKIKNQLGWIPMINLDQIIKDIVEFKNS
jgi:UDP-glucose 4-epimerase